MTLHPTIPNPYTLLNLLLPRTKVYTRLDLKDAFFCVCLAPVSQPIFAFEWEDPVGGTKQQLIWTPPQGFKNPTAILGEALASDLNSFHPEEYGCWLLQYGDDLLLAAETKGKCWKGAKALLQLLMEAGSVQFSSVTQSCLTLCDPMNCSLPGLPVHHQLPEFTQTHVRVSDAIQPSHPLSSPSPPALNPSQHQSLFQ